MLRILIAILIVTFSWNARAERVDLYCKGQEALTKRGETYRYEGSFQLTILKVDGEVAAVIGSEPTPLSVKPDEYFYMRKVPNETTVAEAFSLDRQTLAVFRHYSPSEGVKITFDGSCELYAPKV